MSRTTLADWERRCLAAEKRAEAAEASSRRVKTKLRRNEETLGQAFEAYEQAHRAAGTFHRILVRRAFQDLGPETSREEAKALVDRWVEDAAKRATRASTQQTVVVAFSIEELLRRFNRPGDEEA